jgi:REP element-mobilizing transposase RayT
MARPCRLNVAGAMYHVTARGNRRQPIFVSDADYGRFLAILGDVSARLTWKVCAYCLMPNHYHVVVETAGADLSVGMHRLNSTYAHWFNQRHDIDGHLFQSRFYSGLVTSDWHVLELSRYVALNPVRARLCASPDDWHWSSYRAVIGVDAVPPFVAPELLLGFFGENPAEAMRAFRSFVHDAAARPLAA